MMSFADCVNSWTAEVVSKRLSLATLSFVINVWYCMIFKVFVSIFVYLFFKENLKFIFEFVCLVFINSHFRKLPKI